MRSQCNVIEKNARNLHKDRVEDQNRRLTCRMTLKEGLSLTERGICAIPRPLHCRQHVIALND